MTKGFQNTLLPLVRQTALPENPKLQIQKSIKHSKVNAESRTEPQCLRSWGVSLTMVYLQLSQHFKLGEERVF